MKRLIYAMVLIPVVLLLAGCGGQPNGEKKEDAPATKEGRKEKTGN